MNNPKLMLITDQGVQEFVPKSILDKMISSHQKENLIDDKNDSNLKEEQLVKKLYTMAQVIKIFMTSRPTIYAWIKKGLLHPVTIGGRVYFRPSDIDQLIDDRGKEE